MADNMTDKKRESQEEYLTVQQAAFLLCQSEHNIMETIKRGKLQAVKKNQRMFIPVASLKAYVNAILGKYQEAIIFLDLPDDEKAGYLNELLPAAYHGRSPDPSRYMTVIQVSCLAGCSRQTVYDLIRKRVFKKVQRFGRMYIPISDFAGFILEKMNRIRPALEYFTEDSFSFWEREENDWKEFYQMSREERGYRCQNSVRS